MTNYLCSVKVSVDIFNNIEIYLLLFITIQELLTYFRERALR